MITLNEQILELLKIADLSSMLKIEKLLEDNLLKDPTNVDLLFKLAMLEFHPPFNDEQKCLSIINKILNIDSLNANALLLFACVNYYCLTGVNSNLFQKLNFLAKTTTIEKAAMLKYVATWYYNNKAEKGNLEELLKESIEKGKTHVNNYIALAKILLNRNQFSEAKLLVHKAISNVSRIYFDNQDYYDSTDIEEFLNERVKGIYLTSYSFNELKKLEELLTIY